MKKISILLLVLLSLTGCISSVGQYRGIANGVEIKRATDGELIINVSGGASASLGADGTVLAESTSSNSDIINLLKK